MQNLRNFSPTLQALYRVCLLLNKQIRLITSFYAAYILHRPTKKIMFDAWNTRTDFGYIGHANSKCENNFFLPVILFVHALPVLVTTPSDRSPVSN